MRNDCSAHEDCPWVAVIQTLIAPYAPGSIFIPQGWYWIQQVHGAKVPSSHAATLYSRLKLCILTPIFPCCACIYAYLVASSPFIFLLFASLMVMTSDAAGCSRVPTRGAPGGAGGGGAPLFGSLAWPVVCHCFKWMRFGDCHEYGIADALKRRINL